MISSFIQSYTEQIISINYLLMLINAIVHIIFAGGVAKDGGKLHKLHRETLLVSVNSWAFATLLGGVFVAAIYWFMHHSTLTQRQ